MRKILLVLFSVLALTTVGLAQEKRVSPIDGNTGVRFSSSGQMWYGKPSPNMCKGVAPGGFAMWTPCPVSWQKEIIKQGRRGDVSPGSLAFRQEIAANKSKSVAPKVEEKDAPKAPPETSSAYVNRRLDGLLEEKAKPVIISNAKKQELVIASLQLENAKLRLKEFQAEVTKAEDNVAAFWKSIGIDPTKLATEWQASDGQNGDIILTKKEPEKKPDAPKQ